MKKCGAKIQTWYWRWFNLQKSTLSYYKTMKDKWPIKSIKLIDIKITRVALNKFNMKTSNDNRLWQFETKTKEDADEWIRALTQASFKTVH